MTGWRERWSPLLLGLLVLQMLTGRGVLGTNSTTTLAVALVWIAAEGSGQAPSRPTRAHAPVLALLVWATLSLIWTVAPRASLEMVGRYWTAAAASWLLLASGRRPALLRAVAWGAVAALGLNLLAVAVSMAGFNGYSKLNYALPLSRNSMALRIVLAALLSVPVLGPRFLAVAPPVALFVGVTTSRGIVLSSALAAGAAWWAAGRPRPSRRLLLSMAACVAALGIGFSLVSGAKDVRRRFSTSPQERSPSVLSGRDLLWVYGYEMVRDRPLRGTGLRSFSVEFDRRMPAAVAAGRRPQRPGQAAHNVWVDLASGLGLPGLLLGLAVCVQAVRRLGRLEPHGVGLIVLLLGLSLWGDVGFQVLVAVGVALASERAT